VYCLFFFATHFFSFLFVSFHGLNLSYFGGYYSCLLEIMYVKFPSFVHLSRFYFLSALLFASPSFESINTMRDSGMEMSIQNEHPVYGTRDVIK